MVWNFAIIAGVVSFSVCQLDEQLTGSKEKCLGEILLRDVISSPREKYTDISFIGHQVSI